MNLYTIVHKSDFFAKKRLFLPTNYDKIIPYSENQNIEKGG